MHTHNTCKRFNQISKPKPQTRELPSVNIFNFANPSFKIDKIINRNIERGSQSTSLYYTMSLYVQTYQPYLSNQISITAYYCFKVWMSTKGMHINAEPHIDCIIMMMASPPFYPLRNVKECKMVK